MTALDTSKLRVRALAIPWFLPEDWARVREISADRDTLPESYEVWVAIVTYQIEQLGAEKRLIEKVLVDPSDLQAWCEHEGKPVDATTRTAFVAMLVEAKRKSGASAAT